MTILFQSQRLSIQVTAGGGERLAGSWVNVPLMASDTVALIIKDDAQRHREGEIQEGNER